MRAGHALNRASGCFVNLSNHSVTTWSSEQLAAAKSLALGDPTDLVGAMPLVPSDADERAVADLAASIADRALAMGALGAMVSTEFTLTVALVDALQARGVRCFAATTERRAREVVRDGHTVKESVFAFVRWREFRPSTPI